ncbi:unnamed protein product, partial [marine sediment metagenome]
PNSETADPLWRTAMPDVEKKLNTHPEYSGSLNFVKIGEDK